MKSHTVQGIKDDAKVVGKKIKDGSIAAGNRVKSDYQHARDKLIEAENKAEAYVAEHPKRSMAVAAGVGAIAGAAATAYVMRNKHTSKENK